MNSSYEFGLSNLTIDIDKISTPHISDCSSGGITEILLRLTDIYFQKRIQ